MDAFTTNQYTSIINDIALDRAGGSGATATAALAATGRLYSATITDGGADYEVGDVLTVAAPGTGGTFTVTSVDEDGVITGIELTTAGTGYGNVTDAVTTTDSAAGTGATLNTVTERGIASVTVTAPGEGYLICNALPATTHGSGGVLTPVLSNGTVDSITVDSAGWYRDVPVITITSAPQTGAQLLTALRAWDTAQQDARLKEALIDSQFVNVGTITSSATVNAAIAAL